MARLICVMGESGSGKTTSLRNLDPAKTIIFDADKKGLSWRGWRSQYGAVQANYIATDVPGAVQNYLRTVNDSERYRHITTAVIDTVNGLMVADEYRHRTEKGYDKWNDLAWSVYGLIDYALTMRGNLTVVFLAHSQTERDDTGALFTRVKTSGRKLDKIVLESKFSTVLLAKNDGGAYVFETSSPLSTCKTPVGLYEQKTIPNDIAQVIRDLQEYEGQPPVEKETEHEAD